MKINRRTFFISGLASTIGLFYFNKKIFYSDIQLFFDNFENLIPLNDFRIIRIKPNFSQQELFHRIKNTGIQESILFFEKLIKNEYQHDKLIYMGNWIVSETEYQLLKIKIDYD